MNTDREVPVELAVQNVSVAYNNGHVALYDASFRLQKGTITALVGVNGSGKSTLFKTIMGFIKPMSGSVTICSEPVRQAQKHRLLAYMNFLRIPNKEDKEIAERSLERVQMLEFKDRQIGELSGGQKKRVFLARALAQRGKIILLDEPFTGVDVKTETAIIDLLRELKNDGHLIFVSTHDLGSVPEFCDHVVIINKTVLASGPTETTFTADNLIKAFGGALRSIKLDHTDNPEESAHEFKIFTDDEGALVTKREGKPYRRGIRNTEVVSPK